MTRRRLRHLCGTRVLDPRPVVRPGARAFRSGPPRSSGFASAAIALVWVTAASQWIVTDTVVPWDAKNQSYAFFRFLASTMHAGSMPFWNPYHYGGHPSVADPQSLIFAPVFMVWAWFDARPSMVAFDLMVHAHLLVGGLALGAMGWRMGWPLPAAVLAATVFMLGGPASGRLQHTGMILSYALFPPALLLLSLALQRRSIPIAAGFAAVAAMLTLERNHASLLLCFTLAAVLAGEIVSAADRRRWLRERRAVFATIVVVAAALLTAPLLLTMQFAACPIVRKCRSTGRWKPRFIRPTSRDGSRQRDGLAGEHANLLGPQLRYVARSGATDRSFNYLFVGVTTVIVPALVRHCRRWAPAPRPPAADGRAGRGAPLHAGPYTPLYALAFDYVPGINLFRRPVDGAFVFVAALAILAGHLLAEYVREGLPRRSLWRSAAVAAGAIALTAWAVVFSAKSGHAWICCGRCSRRLRSPWPRSRPCGGQRGRRARASPRPPASQRWLQRSWSGGTPPRASTPSRRHTIPRWSVRWARSGGARGIGTGDRRSSRTRRKAARGSRRRKRTLAEPGHDAGAGGDQRIQSAAHRLVRPPRFAGRNYPHRRSTPVSGIVRRLRLRTGP